jgi:hypothetical protein
VDSNATAPATTRDFTLRIGFVLLSRTARRNAAALSETHGEDDASKNLSGA